MRNGPTVWRPAVLLQGRRDQKLEPETNRYTEYNTTSLPRSTLSYTNQRATFQESTRDLQDSSGRLEKRAGFERAGWKTGERETVSPTSRMAGLQSKFIVLNFRDNHFSL